MRPSFFHNNPEPLERLQTKHWTPLLDWARTQFDIQLNVSGSILSTAQPTATREKLRKVMESFDQWEMAGLSKEKKSSPLKSCSLNLFVSNGTRYIRIEVFDYCIGFDQESLDSRGSRLGRDC